MAEGIMKDLVKDMDVKVKSAGIFALDGGPVADNSIRSLRDMDIDISEYRSNSINEDLIIESDIILTMSKGHKDNLVLRFPDINNKVFLLNEYAFNIDKDIADPFGGSKSDYDRARDEIYKAISEIIRKLQE